MHTKNDALLFCIFFLERQARCSASLSYSSAEKIFFGPHQLLIWIPFTEPEAATESRIFPLNRHFTDSCWIVRRYYKKDVLSSPLFHCHRCCRVADGIVIDYMLSSKDHEEN